ncbi:MAG: aspartate carbamoyltransferase regulatory subunit [Lachnospirales bacterium]
MLNIDSIENGIVIDHIQAQKSMEIYKYLELDKLESPVAIIKNVRSGKTGKKDIIKIENKTDIDTDVLGFIDPNITINIIEQGKLKEKRQMKLPSTINNVIKCNNPRCVTSIEQEIIHEFKLVNKENRVYRCVYCEQKGKI